MTEKEIKTNIEKLSELNENQWEDLCKGCGLCCLLKHTRREGVYYTGVACNHLDLDTKRCTTYQTRLNNRLFCRKVDLPFVLFSGILPDTCGYIEYIFGKSDKDIKVNFKDIIHEHDMLNMSTDANKESAYPVRKYATVKGPWDFIIKDSLKWQTHSKELCDKYEEFSKNLINSKKKQNTR